MKLSKEKAAEVKKRLMARVKKQKGRDGCWEWDGTRAGKGYPVCEVNGKRITVRRALYIALGKTPYAGDLALKARCKNINCVNPFHMARIRRGKGGRTAATAKKIQAELFEGEKHA